MQKISIVIHGGAGTILKEDMVPDLERAYRQGLEDALAAGYAVLEAGGKAVDAVKEATTIIAADPKGTAQSWIDDTGSKMPVESVTKVVVAPNVEWTMTPAATMKFAKFMRKVGTTKHEPASWKDMFFPEIGSLGGS